MQRVCGTCLWGLFGLLWLLTGPATAGSCDNDWAGRLQSLQGPVEVRRHASSDWRPAHLGQAYCLGDRLRVGSGARASVELDNDTVVRLDQHSTLVFPEPGHDGLSFLELLKGAMHLMSRIRGHLEIRTPFVNAGLEGTEFVVRVGAGETTVVVIEGTVRVSNDHGSLRISDGQAASASIGNAPVLRLDLDPVDAVDWALYYPRIIDDDSDAPLAQAQGLLEVGRVAAAQRQLDTVLADAPDDSEALALASIVALVQGRRDEALALARHAADGEPAAPALLALSYAQQAGGDLQQAYATAQQATAVFPHDALLWARQAELAAANGLPSAAREAAGRAVAIAPGLSRTRTVLGFAELDGGNHDAAVAAFTEAVALDSADPLPRLGLGLARFAVGETADGRREFEIAVGLDPAYAMARSYLAKAYLAEGRDADAVEQLRLAQQLDPQDPTPLFYDAARLQASNRPIAAIRAYEQSVALNDNRAVLRSGLLLDDDLALRHTAVGTTYAALGLRSVGQRHAARALAANPGNPDVHTLTADLLRDTPGTGVARVSERLQAQLLQPIAATPTGPAESVLERDPLLRSARFQAGGSDYGRLFATDPPRLQADAFAGGNDSAGVQLLHANRIDDVSYNLGYLDYRTDGWRDDADIDHTGLEGLVQWQVNDRVALQFGAQRQDRQQGDLRLGFAPSQGTPDRESRELELETVRAGARIQVDDRSVLLLSAARSRRDEGLVQSGSPFTRLVDSDFDGRLFELQYQRSLDTLELVLGASHRQVDLVSTVALRAGPFSLPAAVDDDDDIEATTFYAYANWSPSPALELTVGASHDSNERYDNLAGSTVLDESHLNPKLGMVWQALPAVTVRAAYSESTKQTLVTQASLEPTQLAGFTQFHDDFNDTRSRLRGAAIDLQITDDISATVQHRVRDVRHPTVDYDLEERVSSIELAAILNDQWSASVGIRRARDDLSWNTPYRLTTRTLPVSLHYRSPHGYFADLAWTRFDQDWQTGNDDVDTRFDAVDVSAGYRWDRNRYEVRFGIDDLLDDVDEYRDDRDKFNDQFNVYRPFTPGRTVWASIGVAWD